MGAESASGGDYGWQPGSRQMHGGGGGGRGLAGGDSRRDGDAAQSLRAAAAVAPLRMHERDAGESGELPLQRRGRTREAATGARPLERRGGGGGGGGGEGG